MSLRALLVGIDDYAAAPLRGCRNDASQLQALLQQRYGLSDGQQRLLLDDAASAAAIRDGLQWLAERDDDGLPERRLFFFAGHGTLTADQDGDEPDGADEALLPHDYLTAGLLPDDQLRALYAQFDPAIQLVLIMDCCHSGTIARGLDDDIRARFLPLDAAEEQRIAAARVAFQQRQQAQIIAQLRSIAGQPDDEQRLHETARRLIALIGQQTAPAAPAENIVLLAACREDQTAGDARFGDSFHGVLSFYLLQLLSERAELTYAQLISLLRPRLQMGKFTQQPQLHCADALLDQPFLR